MLHYCPEYETSSKKRNCFNQILLIQKLMFHGTQSILGGSKNACTVPGPAKNRKIRKVTLKSLVSSSHQLSAILHRKIVFQTI